MIYGYARVSTDGQCRNGNGLAVQEQQLLGQGVEKIFCESFTGTKKRRPELDKLLAVIQPGDTLVVTKLDRIARSTHDGLEIIDELVRKGANIHILNMGQFDSSPSGKLMRSIFFAFAEFERDMIVQRTSEGKEEKRRKDPTWKEGRKKITLPEFQKFLEKQKGGLMTVDECCTALGISRSTWYARVREVN